MIAKSSKFANLKRKIFESAAMGAAFLIVLGGIMGFFVYQNVSAQHKRSALEGRLDDLRAQVDELSLQREMLEANIARSQTEEYEEKILREQGLYQKEGERVITVLPPETAAETAPEGVEEQKKIWWKLWTWF